MEAKQEILTALLAAQKQGDCENEGRLFHKIFYKKLRSGCQHSKKPIHLRLLERVVFGASECWHYCGFVGPFGYGRLTFNGIEQMAHRVSYQAFVGPIPKGLCVLHKCDNRCCINPEHLWLGSYTDNRRDCVAKGRSKTNSRKGFKHQTNAVTPEAFERMKELRSKNLSYKKISSEIGLGTMVVFHALNKRFNTLQTQTKPKQERTNTQ